MTMVKNKLAKNLNKEGSDDEDDEMVIKKGKANKFDGYKNKDDEIDEEDEENEDEGNNNKNDFKSKME